MKKAIIFLTFFSLVLSISALMPPYDNDFSSFEKSAFLQSRRVNFDIKDIKQRKGYMKALVILMDFPDYRWNHTGDTLFDNDSLWYTKVHFEDMLSSENTYRHPGSVSSYTGSLRDYYKKNSYENFDVECDLVGYFTAINNFAYYCEDYGYNDWYLIQEALDSADKYIDFSDYDNDGDGTTDAIFFVHAGPGAEALPEPERIHYIWSYMSYLGQTRDGVSLGAYSMQPEDGTIGVFCHEFGHQLGLPDWYDYDYSSNGVGEWCLMGGGGWCYKDVNDPHGTSPSYISAAGKYLLGWIIPTIAGTNIENAHIPPSENTPFAFLLKDSTMPSSEYFIVENRQNISFDEGLTRRQVDLGMDKSHGLIIWHIDETVADNDNELHKQLDVEEASPFFDGAAYYEHLDYERTYPDYIKLYNGNRGDNGDTWPGYSEWNTDTSDFLNRNITDFNTYSHPSAKRYSGANTLVGVENITETDTMISADILVRVQNAVTSPGFASALVGGDLFLIEWESSAAGGVLYDSVFFNYNNGIWTFITKDTAESNEFLWTVPDINSDSCRIRIVSSNNFSRKSEAFSSFFKITKSASVINIPARTERTTENTMKTFYTSIESANSDIANTGLTVFDIAGNKIDKIYISGKYFTRKPKNADAFSFEYITVIGR